MSFRFSSHASDVVKTAELKSRDSGSIIYPLHFLILILNTHDATACRILKELYGVNLKSLEKAAKQTLSTLNQTDPSRSPFLFAPEAKKTIKFAVDEARGLGHHYVGTEHLLLSMLRINSTAAILKRFGVNPKVARQEILHANLGIPKRTI